MRLNGGCITDIGISRKVNQDAIFLRYMEKNGQYFAVGAVCDGIGGLEYGERASGLVIQEIRKWFGAIASWINIEEIKPEILCAHLLDGVEEWNAKVRNLSAAERIRTGTTLSLLLLIREYYYIVQVGDSRIYRYRGCLEQLTTDATVARLKNGKMKNYLANYMGKDEKLWFSTAQGTFREGDMFFFCSDGGYHFLTEKDVGEVYTNYGRKTDLKIELEKLLKMMISRGESDNISMGIIMTEKKKIGGWRNHIRK
ncbi:MAG: hypothetical protein HDQ96_14660 [Lachnospiraceae bacterium]|nr:hypothetical protein [Lachnospiraceae bacterium]